MDHEDFDSPNSDSAGQSEGKGSFDLPRRRRARTLVEDEGGDTAPIPRDKRNPSHMPQQQVIFIIIVNAVLSLIISLVVVSVVGRRAPAPLEPADVSATSVAQTNPSATMTPALDLEETTQAAAGSTEPESTEIPIQPTLTDIGPVDTPTPTYYVVQPGDTVSTIAQQFDVDQDDLMRANGVEDANFLMLGQELIIPIGGLPLATATLPSAPAVTDTPMPFEPPTPLPIGASTPIVPAASVVPPPTSVPTLSPVPVSDVRITLEALSPGDPVKETMYIVNQGLYVRLTGWTLSDDDDSVYVFPEFGLGGNGAAIALHTGSGDNTVTDLYWGRQAVAWDPGDVITLKDGEGKVMVSYTVPMPSVEEGP